MRSIREAVGSISTLVLAWVAAAGVGCASRDYAQCSSGLLCPAPKLCAEPSGLCVSQPQIAACEGRVDGASCSLRPPKASLNAVRAFSRSDVWAVGDAGTVLHFDGSTWSAVDVPAAVQVNAVWGTGPTNLFAVGDLGTALHFDGDSWRLVPTRATGSLEGVGGADGDVWIAGDSYIGRFDGAQFTATETGLPRSVYTAVWASAANDVFVTTELGFVGHFDGTTWRMLDTGVVTDLASVWGTSPSDVFAVGIDGVIVHFDGVMWTKMESGTTSELTEVFGRDAASVFAVGVLGTLLHYDGAVWSPLASGSMASLNSIAIVGRDGFALGDGGAIIEGHDLDWFSALFDGRCTYRVCVTIPPEPPP